MFSWTAAFFRLPVLAVAANARNAEKDGIRFKNLPKFLTMKKIHFIKNLFHLL